MSVLYTNNATTTLSASITNSTTSLSVASGKGSLFPAITGSDFFFVTISNSAGTNEIVKVTARSVDTFTIVRAQDGTSAAAWSAGDKVELRITKAMLDQFKTDASTVLQVVSTSTTTSVINNTTTYVDSGLTLSITPSSASNKILAIASLPFQYGSNNYVYDNLRLMRGATQVSIVTIGNSVNAYVVVYNVHNIMYLDSPATTSSVTYKIQHRISSSSGEYGGEIFCPDTNTATLTLMEIAA